MKKLKNWLLAAVLALGMFAGEAMLNVRGAEALEANKPYTEADRAYWTEVMEGYERDNPGVRYKLFKAGKYVLTEQERIISQSYIDNFIEEFEDFIKDSSDIIPWLKYVDMGKIRERLNNVEIIFSMVSDHPNNIRGDYSRASCGKGLIWIKFVPEDVDLEHKTSCVTHELVHSLDWDSLSSESILHEGFATYKQRKLDERNRKYRFNVENFLHQSDEVEVLMNIIFELYWEHQLEPDSMKKNGMEFEKKQNIIKWDNFLEVSKSFFENQAVTDKERAKVIAALKYVEKTPRLDVTNPQSYSIFAYYSMRGDTKAKLRDDIIAGINNIYKEEDIENNIEASINKLSALFPSNRYTANDLYQRIIFSNLDGCKNASALETAEVEIIKERLTSNYMNSMKMNSVDNTRCFSELGNYLGLQSKIYNFSKRDGFDYYTHATAEDCAALAVVKQLEFLFSKESVDKFKSQNNFDDIWWELEEFEPNVRWEEYANKAKTGRDFIKLLINDCFVSPAEKAKTAADVAIIKGRLHDFADENRFVIEAAGLVDLYNDGLTRIEQIL